MTRAGVEPLVGLAVRLRALGAEVRMCALKDIARVAIEAIRAQGRRALVSRGWADLALIDDRDDCFAVGEVNQQALFGRVAAVVHHGGAGTTTTAARAGAPQARARAAAVAGAIRTDGATWPRRCCSTRSAGKGRQCPRERCGIVEPGAEHESLPAQAT
jgi:hypothetical protein